MWNLGHLLEVHIMQKKQCVKFKNRKDIHIKMQSKSVYKIPNGKLLKISLRYINNFISEIRIMGDFFAYPEEAIEVMEKELINSSLNRESLLNKINSVIKENNIEFIGLNAEGLTDGIMMCLK